MNNLFPIPFGRYPRTKDHEVYKKKLLEIFDADNPSGSDSQDIKTDFRCKKRKAYSRYYRLTMKALGKHLSHIRSSMGYKAAILNMWYQQSTRGQYHGVHNHGVLGMSCVWYVEFNPSVHKGTTFIAPFHSPMSGERLQDTPKVEEGDLVVFPSFLLHEQEPNDSDERRSVISFNLSADPSKAFHSYG
jgi:hypothetical protein